jgi:hypothetical protein
VCQILNPCEVALGDCLKVHEDGSIEALDARGEAIIDAIGLDNADYTHFRKVMLRIVRLAQREDPETFTLLMKYPERLDDLRELSPPGGNTKPEGVHNCFYARRERGELEEVY